MRRFEDLDADAQRRISAAAPELREFLIASCPTSEMEAAAKAAAAEHDQHRLREERLALLELADDAEAGRCCAMRIVSSSARLASGMTISAGA